MAQENPCMQCEASYCCWYFHLQDIRAERFMHFDYLRFLLNFEDIELLLGPDGSWGVYLRRPCRHLDPETRLCKIRGTEAHPNVCRTYNPYDCFYKSKLSGTDPRSKFVRVDRHRLAMVLDEVQFDEFGFAMAVPSAGAIRAWERRPRRRTVGALARRDPLP
jgi:Fe-S-cluster containining protein